MMVCCFLRMKSSMPRRSFMNNGFFVKKAAVGGLKAKNTIRYN